MPDTPQRPARPAAPIGSDSSADATGLNSMRVDADAVDDLHLLAASLEHPAPSARASIIARPPRSSRMAIRATFIPILLTGGILCETLAAAWFATDADSPYRRVSVALPIILMVSGAVLIAAAAINMLLSRRAPR